MMGLYHFLTTGVWDELGPKRVISDPVGETVMWGHEWASLWAGRSPESVEFLLAEMEADKPLIIIRPKVLEFSPGIPSCFWEEEGGTPYRGQETAKERIDFHIRALDYESGFRALLTGMAGSGKTSLARIIAGRIGRLPYYELIPSQLEDRDTLDAFMKQLVKDREAIVFIDEVHSLPHLESFFSTLDHVDPYYPLSTGDRLEIPKSISWISATTDPGAIDSLAGGPLMRRLEPAIRLEPPTEEELAQIVMDRGASEELVVRPEAAEAIAARAGRLPWQAVLAFQEAAVVAKVAAKGEVTVEDAQKAFEMMGLDKNGLRPEDRDVIYALLSVKKPIRSTGEVLHVMSENAVLATSGVDKNLYRKRIQPFLLRNGFLTIRSGQCLTDKAVQEYGGKP